MPYKRTGRLPGRPKVKEYVTLMARVDVALADQVKRYARLHRQTISDLIRDGLAWRITDGEPFTDVLSDRYSDIQKEFLSDRNESLLDTLVGETDSAGLAELLSDTNNFAIETILSDTNRDKEFLSDRNKDESILSDAQRDTEILSATQADSADIVSDRKTEDAGYDATKCFLGALCRHGHDYQNTGCSLRRLAPRPRDQECLECQRQRQARKRQQPGA